MIMLEPGSRYEMNPMDFCYITSHSLKTAAILKKIANIFPNNCSLKCNGLIKSNNNLIFNVKNNCAIY